MILIKDQSNPHPRLCPPEDRESTPFTETTECVLLTNQEVWLVAHLRNFAVIFESRLLGENPTSMAHDHDGHFG